MFKRCENCIWFDQCGCESACDNYDPTSDDENAMNEEIAYENDLRERQDLYMKQVEEQNY